MDFDIPTDLIDKAQIGFRAAVGLPSFDRKDTNLPSISNVEALICSLDSSSSSDLRCKSCKCKLLRDLQSLICIYCGEYQKKNKDLPPPDPISFKSTHGYTWLLQSLNFNGSERIGSLAEGSGINGGQTPAEDELTISELLDLKISLPDEPVHIENNFNIKTSEHNSSLNHGSTDFNHFLTTSMSKGAIVPEVLEEQVVFSKADQEKIVEVQENLTSDWNAEFQFADIKMESEKPKVNLFEGAEVDLSTHMDVGFGQTEGSDFKQPNDDSDLFQDDFFSNMSPTTFKQNEQLDSVVQAKGGLSGNLNDFNSEKVEGDWFNDDNWLKSSVKNTLNDVSVQDKPNNSSTDWFENTIWQKDSANNNTNTTEDNNLFDIKPHANDLISPEKPDHDNSDKHHLDVTDWSQNDQWAIGGSSLTTNIVGIKDDDNDDGFGEWNDFTSSDGNQDPIQDSWKESGNVKIDFGTSDRKSELNLFQSTVDSQEADFGKFFQSDIVSGDENSNERHAEYDIFSEVYTTTRNANTEVGNNTGGSKNGKVTPNPTTSPNDDVQMLMSQMHDLSFMLTNELSIPSELNNISTSHS